MPTQKTIKSSITIKKYAIITTVISGRSSTLSKDPALAQVMSVTASNITSNSEK